MLIALLVWVDRGAPRPPLAAGAAAVLAAALPAVIPYERLIGVPSQSDTLSMLALWRVHERWVALDEVVAVVVVCSVLAALAFLVVPRRLAILLPLVRARLLPAIARPISARMEYAAVGRARGGDHKQDREWVDHAVAGRGEVGVLWTGQRLALLRAGRTSSSTAASVPSSTSSTPMEGGLPADAGEARPPDGRPARRTRRPASSSATARPSSSATSCAKDGARNVVLYEVDAAAALRPRSSRDCTRPTPGRGRPSRTRASTARAGRLRSRCRAIPRSIRSRSRVQVRGDEGVGDRSRRTAARTCSLRR